MGNLWTTRRFFFLLSPKVDLTNPGCLGSMNFFFFSNFVQAVPLSFFLSMADRSSMVCSFSVKKKLRLPGSVSRFLSFYVL